MQKSEEDPLSALRKLQYSLDEVWGSVGGIYESVRQLSLVVQAQQERATYMEAAATADRSQLEEFGEWMKDAQTQMGYHDEKLASTNVLMQGLQKKTVNVEKRLEQVGSMSRDARYTADVAMETLREQTAQLAKCQDFLQDLKRHREETVVRGTHVSTFHDDTSSSLRHALSLVIEQEDAARPCLQEQHNCLAVWEGKPHETDTMALKLQDDSKRSDVQNKDLHDTVQDTTCIASDFHTRWKGAGTEASTDCSWLKSALNQLSGRCDDSQRISGKLQRVCSDAASFQVESVESQARLGHVAAMVAFFNDVCHASDKEAHGAHEIPGIPCKYVHVHTDAGVSLLPFPGTSESGMPVRHIRNVCQ